MSEHAESILRALVDYCYFDLRHVDDDPPLDDPSLIVDGNADISREDAAWLQAKLAEWYTPRTTKVRSIGGDIVALDGPDIE